MTSKIKVDNITDQDDNNIINESGDVITVGASGDTVAVAGNIVKSNALLSQGLVEQELLIGRQVLSKQQHLQQHLEKAIFVILQEVLFK